MKASQYNYFYKPAEIVGEPQEADSPICLFNALERTHLSLDAEQHRLVCSILEEPDKTDLPSPAAEMKAVLIDKGMLVPDEVDELAIVRMRHRAGRFSSTYLSLAINLTHHCNLRCVYCYKPPKPQTMDEATLHKILALVQRQSAGLKNMMVRWYGGEPLLAFDKLKYLGEELDKICHRQGIRLNCGLITNGTLLTREVCQELMAKLNPRYILVSLDGDAEIHNQRRPCANQQGSFDMIMHNLEEITQLHPLPPVSIRVNIDKQNLQTLPQLLDRLIQQGLREKVHLAMGHVAPLTTAACKNAAFCFSRSEFFDQASSYFMQLCRERQFQVTLPPDANKSGRCIATSLNSYIIAPNGELYKCDNEVGDAEAQVGILDEQGRIKANYRMAKWLGWDITDREQCRACALLPFCMGGCAYRWLKGVDTEKSADQHCFEWNRTLKKIYIDFHHGKDPQVF